MLHIWIAFAGWTLIIFGLIGLLALFWQFSLSALAINLILILIGALDLRNLKRAHTAPKPAYLQIVMTQFILGLIISGSLVWMGLSFPNSEIYNQLANQLTPLFGQSPEKQQLLDNLSQIMRWGLPLGAAIIMASQIVVCRAIYKRTKIPPSLAK